MSSSSPPSDSQLHWKLLYTKPRAEVWAEANLRKQGFRTLMPRVAGRGGFVPLFSRYIFVGHEPRQRFESLRSTFGVLYVVNCGDRAAQVSADVIAEITERMDAHGVVRLGRKERDPLFARHDRERVRTLIKLAEAGYRVLAA